LEAAAFGLLLLQKKRIQTFKTETMNQLMLAASVDRLL